MKRAIWKRRARGGLFARWKPAFLLVALAGGVIALGSGCERPVTRERDLLIATATTGGTFYPVGVAMATLITTELRESDGILASAITSSGSAENIRMLENGEAQLAILQALFGAMAWQGTGVYENRPVRELCGLAMLWENVEQVVLLQRLAGSGTIDDLRTIQGHSISIGPRWSGTEVSARTILETLGLAPVENFEATYLGYGASADAMTNRRISGMFLAGGIPTAAITQSFASLGSGQVVLLEFDDAHLARLRERYPVWERFVIPANMYPGQAAPVRTIAQPNILATSARMSDEVIYRVMQTLWRNVEQLHRHHAATRSMTLERAVEGLPLPLHPGAVKFYREAGIEIPHHLQTPDE